MQFTWFHHLLRDTYAPLEGKLLVERDQRVESVLMNAGDWIYWLGWIAVVAIYVVMIYLTWWGLFGDKPHGRRRCPQCWYDLSHTPGMTCGECGRVARSERDLGRYRRRWKQRPETGLAG